MKGLKLEKRAKFIITSALLSAGFVGINFLADDFRFWAIGGLTLLTLILFVWSLIEGLEINATLLSLVLPALFTLGVGLFWFLLPAIIFARLPVVILYGIGIYALCLTSNIYTVSAIRTIALVRAARGVGFVLTLFTGFLLFDAALSLRLPIWFTPPIIGAISIPLFLQGLWSSDLDKKISKELIFSSLLFSLGLLEISVLLFFWPVTVAVGSLFLTTAVYILLGLGQADQEDRLFKQTVRDYLTVGIVVFLATFFATHWGG